MIFNLLLLQRFRSFFTIYRSDGRNISVYVTEVYLILERDKQNKSFSESDMNATENSSSVSTGLPKSDFETASNPILPVSALRDRVKNTLMDEIMKYFKIFTIYFHLAPGRLVYSKKKLYIGLIPHILCWI